MGPNTHSSTVCGTKGNAGLIDSEGAVGVDVVGCVSPACRAHEFSLECAM